MNKLYFGDNLSKGLAGKIPSGENHPAFGKPAKNRRADFTPAYNLFLSLSTEMEFREKRRIIGKSFPDVPYTTLTRWVRKWESEQQSQLSP